VPSIFNDIHCVVPGFLYSFNTANIISFVEYCYCSSTPLLIRLEIFERFNFGLKITDPSF